MKIYLYLREWDINLSLKPTTPTTEWASFKISVALAATDKKVKWSKIQDFKSCRGEAFRDYFTGR